MSRVRIFLIAAIILSPAAAEALPRFAARTGAECTLCHVSPSGGGVRNRYGSNIYQRTMLPILWDDEETGEEGTISSFSGALTDWLHLGADLRLAYLYAKPPTTSSFFMMQADLYTAANFSPHVTAVFDIGAYSGFEAWVLIRAATEPSDFNLYLKAGHFLPAFGIRDVNHELYTRGGIGLGATDRDTGLEATAFAGPFSLSVALVNGTFDDAIFDTRGSKTRSFEKAIAARAALRFSLSDWVNAQIGASLYSNDNVDSTNPLFSGFLPAGGAMLSAEGVDEMRAGGFILASLGRFVYSGEVVYVRDQFIDSGLPSLRGYASYQELDLLLTQGWELGATVEFLDPDLELSENSTLRLGLFTEIFVHTFVELRLMLRRTSSEVPRFDGVTEFVAFAHSFF